MTAVLQSLEQLWATTVPTQVPAREQWVLWLGMHDEGTLRYAVNETAMKAFRMGGRMSQDHAIRYASKCMNSRTRNSAQR